MTREEIKAAWERKPNGVNIIDFALAMVAKQREEDDKRLCPHCGEARKP